MIIHILLLMICTFLLSWLMVRNNLSLVMIIDDINVFSCSDMEFVQNFTPPDFQAENFTPSTSPNFSSFSKKKHKK